MHVEHYYAQNYEYYTHVIIVMHIMQNLLINLGIKCTDYAKTSQLAHLARVSTGPGRRDQRPGTIGRMIPLALTAAAANGLIWLQKAIVLVQSLCFITAVLARAATATKSFLHAV